MITITDVVLLFNSGTLNKKLRSNVLRVKGEATARRLSGSTDIACRFRWVKGKPLASVGVTTHTLLAHIRIFQFN